MNFSRSKISNVLCVEVLILISLITVIQQEPYAASSVAAVILASAISPMMSPAYTPPLRICGDFHINEETKALLGQFAHDLLGDQRFKTLQELFGQQMAYDMLHTLPQETKKREGLHAAYIGYGEFINIMQNFATYYVEHYTTQPTQAAEQEIVED